MKVTVLLENRKLSENLCAAHGLSLFVETGGKKLLFDFGPGAMLRENAEKLGADLRDAELCVLSHGHYDHGGGIEEFFKINSTAKIYAGRGVFGGFYAVDETSARYIGLDPALENSGRFVYSDGNRRPAENLLLFSDVSGSELLPKGGAALQEKLGNEFFPDKFLHEQYMLAFEGDRIFLFSGCAHRGIVNIMERAAEICGRAPDYAFSGFHLAAPGSAQESGELIEAIGRRLLEFGTVFYTGHCTGLKPYEILKGVMGEKLNYMPTGAVIDIE